jgi:hypothetical protein
MHYNSEGMKINGSFRTHDKNHTLCDKLKCDYKFYFLFPAQVTPPFCHGEEDGRWGENKMQSDPKIGLRKTKW